eukprot:2739477-Pyramimonas_sp.AAC.1
MSVACDVIRTRTLDAGVTHLLNEFVHFLNGTYEWGHGGQYSQDKQCVSAVYGGPDTRPNYVFQVDGLDRDDADFRTSQSRWHSASKSCNLQETPHPLYEPPTCRLPPIPSYGKQRG